MTRPFLLVSLSAALFLGAGCSRPLDTSYGRVSGRSLNGTGVFAQLLRDAGHDVRVARRLNDDVAEFADTIVRFAPRPGPPDADEAAWFLDWQTSGGDTRLVYICQDYDAEVEYWTALLKSLPASASDRKRLERLQDQASHWASHLPKPAETPADALYWFGLDDRPGAVSAAQTLEGPWADGVDVPAAALPRHASLRVNTENQSPLLLADGKALAIEWVWGEQPDDDLGLVLVIANPSFLLNATLVNPARRPLTSRVVDWIGDPPRSIVFLEGPSPLATDDDSPSLWELPFRIPTLGWILAHVAALGLAAALSRALILGRPQPAPPSGADRPRAHAEALGSLLSRTRDDRLAHSLLDSYRRWRHPPTSPPGSSTPSHRI